MAGIGEGVVIGVTSGLVVSAILGLAHWIRLRWRKQKEFLCRTIISYKERMQDEHWSRQLEIFKVKSKKFCKKVAP